MNEHTAYSNVRINAPVEKVWEALTDPGMIKQYMFNADVRSDWKEGSRITWRGAFKGRSFMDTGKVLAVAAPRHLRYSHMSELSAGEHVVDIRLHERKGMTELQLTQNNNANARARGDSERNWSMMLADMKRMLET